MATSTVTVFPCGIAADFDYIGLLEGLLELAGDAWELAEIGTPKRQHGDVIDLWRDHWRDSKELDSEQLAQVNEQLMAYREWATSVQELVGYDTFADKPSWLVDHAVDMVVHIAEAIFNAEAVLALSVVWPLSSVA